jgi:NAD-dependent deacetylase sirtuin 4
MALAELEKQGHIGVAFEDKETYYQQDDEEDALRWAFTSGSQTLSVLTQNVDGLHRKAGSKYLSELHGRNDVLKCMKCGSFHCRHKFHDMLEDLNKDWVREINREKGFGEGVSHSDRLRPDGDAHVNREVYDDVLVPPCPNCGIGFLKPDVVFFGDSVPRSRVNLCHAAVAASDGLLCMGSSLAVYSAFRFVQSASKKHIPIAILNVGETRAEKSGLDVLKIESPIGPTLMALTKNLS